MKVTYPLCFDLLPFLIMTKIVRFPYKKQAFLSKSIGLNLLLDENRMNFIQIYSFNSTFG